MGFYAPVPPVNKPRLSLAAGIIDLAAGGLSMVSLLFATVVLRSAVSDGGLPSFLVLLPLVMLVPGVLAIVGGIFALKRRNWVMALIGSIGLAVTSTMPGIAAVVLTVMARDEFDR